VYLYFQQTQILEDQKTLLNRELNREARQAHTNILRERVKMWRGREEKFDNEPVDVNRATQESNGGNLPEVHYTGVKPAKASNSGWVFGQEDEFCVIPRDLHSDRYFRDFLENHADDVAELVEEINDLYDRFEEKRDGFYDEFPNREPVEFEDMTVEYRDHYSKWVLGQISEIIRGNSDKERLKEIAESAISSEAPTGIPEENITVYPGHFIGYEANSFLEVHSHDEDLWDDSREQVEKELIKLLNEEIDRISETAEFELGFEAAKILVEIKSKIEELDRTLIEYEGKPIYSGECEYLEEVLV
jgi:hypothetical protein